MSDQNYEPGSSDEVYQPNDDGEAPGEIVDTDQAFGDNNDDVLYDAGYSPPEKPLGLGHHGETLSEQLEGESLDQRLAEEIPDPNLAFDDPLDEKPSTPDGVADVDSDVDYDRVDENVVDPEDLIYSEVGEERAGRLVAPDEGLEEDREKDLVGDDVGIDGAAASAEEAAVHIIPE